MRDVTGYTSVPYIDCSNSAAGTKLARPNTSITRNGTLRSTPRVSKRNWRRNWRHAVAGPKAGSTRTPDGAGTDASAGSPASMAGPFLPRRNRPLPVPVRVVRNTANVAANSPSPIAVHSTRLADR